MSEDIALAIKIANGSTPPIPGASTFGKLYTFGGEHKQLEALQDLIVKYAREAKPKRPLCLAVFGQPGSGKSFAVDEIIALAQTSLNDVQLRQTTLNMTQVADALSVTRLLARVAGEQKDDTVPVLFIDEFDTSRNGAPLGWLSWFLAPMHDGEFLHEGAAIRLTRAVYVFAGGTAETMEAFAEERSAEFRGAKGPDFVSRLRGYVDVKGPNEEPRILRRAILLRSELNRRLSRGGGNVLNSEDEKLLESLLCVGRYRHGARSISAIVEMSDIPLNSSSLSWLMLPKKHLLKLHVDLGPLDYERIGGSIALSGYTSDNEPAFKCGVEVANLLWNEGATLSHVWTDKNQALIKSFGDMLAGRPVEPSQDKADFLERTVRFVGYMSTDLSLKDVDRIISRTDRLRWGIRASSQWPLEQPELEELGDDDDLRSLVSLFRRRFSMSEASIARFAIGGWTEGHKSRIPGIAEEVMLTLAFNKPVYVAGGLDGAAQDLGILLGLTNLRQRANTSSFKPYRRDPELIKFAKKFQPPPLNNLPVTSTEMIDFLRDHAYGTRRWPENGLSRQENKALFSSTKPSEVAELVVRGLRKWAATRGRADSVRDTHQGFAGGFLTGDCARLTSGSSDDSIKPSSAPSSPESPATTTRQ